MPSESVSLLEQAGGLIKYVLVAALSLFGWSLKRQVSRIDKLEDNIVPESQLDKTISHFSDTIEKGFKSVEKNMDVMHTQTRLDIREIHKRIDGIIKK